MRNVEKYLKAKAEREKLEKWKDIALELSTDPKFKMAAREEKQKGSGTPPRCACPLNNS